MKSYTAIRVVLTDKEAISRFLVDIHHHWDNFGVYLEFAEGKYFAPNGFWLVRPEGEELCILSDPIFQINFGGEK